MNELRLERPAYKVHETIIIRCKIPWAERKWLDRYRSRMEEDAGHKVTTDEALSDILAKFRQGNPD